jgi:hypothetical protein
MRAALCLFAFGACDERRVILRLPAAAAQQRLIRSKNRYAMRFLRIFLASTQYPCGFSDQYAWKCP